MPSGNLVLSRPWGLIYLYLHHLFMHDPVFQQRMRTQLQILRLILKKNRRTTLVEWSTNEACQARACAYAGTLLSPGLIGDSRFAFVTFATTYTNSDSSHLIVESVWPLHSVWAMCLVSLLYFPAQFPKILGIHNLPADLVNYPLQSISLRRFISPRSTSISLEFSYHSRPALDI